MNDIVLQKNAKLSAGERLIVVDGVTWGRTIISHHGVWGTKYSFQQEAGEIIGTVSKFGRFHEDVVRSMKKRLWHEADWRPTEVLVLEKVRELIATDRLRHPDIVRKEQAAAEQRYREKREQRDHQEQARFEARAREALGINDESQSEVVDSVVAAMRWAQSQ